MSLRNVLDGLTALKEWILDRFGYRGYWHCRRSPDWAEVTSGTRYDLRKETDLGVNIRKRRAQEFRNMETGERRTFVREGARDEWHEYDDREDWPDYAERVIEDGPLWEHDIDQLTIWGVVRLHPRWTEVETF